MRVLPRKLRQRLSVVSRPASIRAHRAWYWPALAITAIACALLLGGFWILGYGPGSFDSSEGRRERAELQERIAALEEEAGKLRSFVVSSDSRIQVERTAQGQLAKQVKALEDDNARLKEELAFFETLLPGEQGKDARLTIHRFRVEPNGLPGEYKYRMLVYQGTGRDSKVFQGSLQFVVSLQRDSKSVIVTLPESRGTTGDSGFQLSFRRVQRVEGLFKVEPNATVKTVQVRVLENGFAQPRATENFSLAS